MVRISSFLIRGDQEHESSADDDDESAGGESSLKASGTKQVRFGLNQLGTCKLASPYLFCANGKKVSVLNFADGSVSNKEYPDVAGEISDISATSSADLTAVAFKGKGFVKIFRVLENSK
jgi:hypothetical protein